MSRYLSHFSLSFDFTLWCDGTPLSGKFSFSLLIITRSDHLVEIVEYWPPIRQSCQKKKCTCVNNRCIRSKISGDQGRPWLSRGWIECEIVTLAGSRWMSNYYITPVEQPRRTGKKGCDSQKSWGGQYVAVFVWSPTPSHTQPFQ